MNIVMRALEDYSVQELQEIVKYIQEQMSESTYNYFGEKADTDLQVLPFEK
ncbi:MAG: hypothetical protein ACRC0G_07795 [Fusobacteriaceae bacterium]